jgi:hypothetical protein
MYTARTLCFGACDLHWICIRSDKEREFPLPQRRSCSALLTTNVALICGARHGLSSVPELKPCLYDITGSAAAPQNPDAAAKGSEPKSLPEPPAQTATGGTTHSSWRPEPQLCKRARGSPHRVDPQGRPSPRTKTQRQHKLRAIFAQRQLHPHTFFVSAQLKRYLSGTGPQAFVPA